MDSGIEIKDIRADTLEVPLSDGPPQTPSQYDFCIVLPLVTVYENGEYDYVVKPELGRNSIESSAVWAGSMSTCTTQCTERLVSFC